MNWWKTVDDCEDKIQVCEKNTVQREPFNNLA